MIPTMMPSQKLKVTVVNISSPIVVDENKVFENYSSHGVELDFIRIPNPGTSPTAPFLYGTMQQRLDALLQAFEKDVPTVWLARGGYGASDLLPHLPWEQLKKLPSKTVIGFSDATALTTALLAKLGWTSIHGAMPFTKFGLEFAERKNRGVFELISFLRGENPAPKIQVAPLLENEGNSLAPRLRGDDKSPTSQLFGGCLHVITGLIGTPYFPKLQDGALVFFEDTNESPQRLLRTWNQFLQSGVLQNISGCIFGPFSGLDPAEQLQTKNWLAERSPFPCFSSNDFGHDDTNLPIGIGYQGSITNNELSWGRTNVTKSY